MSQQSRTPVIIQKEPVIIQQHKKVKKEPVKIQKKLKLHKTELTCGVVLRSGKCLVNHRFSAS